MFTTVICKGHGYRSLNLGSFNDEYAKKWMKKDIWKNIFSKDSCGGWLRTEADSVLKWDANIFWVKLWCSPH